MGVSKLTPEAIYTARMWSIHKQQGTDPREFYQNPISKIRYEALQNQPVPSEIEIFKKQREMLKTHYGPYKKKMDKIIKPINEDLKQGVLDYSIDIQDIMQNLNIFFNGTKGETVSLASIRNNIRNNNLSINEYQKYSQLAKQLYKKISNHDFINGTDFKLKIEELNKYFEKMDILVKKEGVGILTEAGFLSRLSYFNSSLRSRALELGAQEEIKRRLNKVSISNIDVLDTSKTMEVRVSVSGKASSGKLRAGSSDLFINLQLTNKDGKKMSLDEYINILMKEDNKERVISSIVENFKGVGIQAKSSIRKNPKPFSGSRGSVELNDVLGFRTREVKNLNLLSLLMKERKALSAFYKTDINNLNGPIYNSLFTYAISKNLHYVLGSHNVLIATNSGIQYMDEYIFGNGYYIGLTRGSFVNIANIHQKLNLTMKKLK